MPETLGGNKPAIVFSDRQEGLLFKSFVNDSGAALVPGQEVILKTDGTIDKRDAGTEQPIGVVYKGGADGEKVVVAIFGLAIVNAVITPSGASAGATLKPTGVVTDGKPVYVATAAGDYITAILLQATTGASQTKRVMIVYPYKSQTP